MDCKEKTTVQIKTPSLEELQNNQDFVDFVESRLCEYKCVVFLTYNDDKPTQDQIQMLKTYMPRYLLNKYSDKIEFLDIRAIFKVITGKRSIPKVQFSKLFKCYNPVSHVMVYRKNILRLLQEFKTMCWMEQKVDLDNYDGFDLLRFRHFEHFE